MPNLRITVVHSFYSGQSPSGEDFAVFDQVQALEAAGNRVELVTPETNWVSTNNLVNTVSAGMRIASGRGDNPVDVIRRTKPDIVHLHNTFPNWTDTWLEKIGVPTVKTIHNFRDFCAQGGFYRSGASCTACLQKTQLRSVAFGCYRNSRLASIPLAFASLHSKPKKSTWAANLLVALSPRAANLLTAGGIESSRIRLIPNFTRPPYRGEDFARGDHWIYAGYVSEAKGILELVSNWPSGVPLKIFGSGPAIRRLSAQIRGKKITLEGFVSRENILNELRGSKGMVFPSLMAENCPLSYLDAISTGTPTLTFRENSVGDDVAANGTGIVFSDFLDIEKALATFPAPRNFASSIENAQRTHFSQSVWVSKISQAYAELLSKSS